MDLSPAALARLVLPKVPLLLKTAIWHSLWLSPTSSKWDLRTELLIAIIRSLLSSPHPKPILRQQRPSLHDPGIKGKMWISKVAFPAPMDDDARRLLIRAIDDMKEGGESYSAPSSVPVEAEWTGYRANVDSNRPRLDLSEAQHYEKLMSEVTSDVTILYFHGGALYLMDPSSHRLTTSYLARLTRGRCLSVRYRLAPQNAFPCALFDAFITYLSLLYPLRDSYHTVVPATHIILAGDSAGGNLSLALLQLLLQINRTSAPTSTFSFHSHTISLPLPLPGGCANISPWVDLTRSMPSITHNAHYDFLPPPLTRDQAMYFPHDDAWPTNPPRGDLYCDTSMLCHPLVSPLAAKDWTGSCPLFFMYGDEMLADEGEFVAVRAAKQGVSVVAERWEAMPHTFALLMVGSEPSRRGFRRWAGFCEAIAGGREVETRGVWVEARTLRERDVVVEQVPALEDEEVRGRMREAMEKRHLGVEGETKILPKL